jgi:glycosyltransferase involved in cell wall biosynthesis
MNIAVMGTRGYPSTYSGYETFVRHFVPHAIERGHNVLTYCRWRRGGKRAWLEDGAECRYTRGYESKSFSTLTFGLTSSLDVLRRDIDVALVMNCANGLWVPFLNAGGLPVAINVDGVEWRRGKWNWAGKAVFRAGAWTACRRADALVADSMAMGEIWDREFGRLPHYIPYGAKIVEDDANDEIRALGIPPGEYALTVARLVPENNVELTMEALESMPDRPPYVVVGSANYRSDIEDRLARLAGRNDVWWLGHVSNQRLLDQLWRNCAVYVHGHSVGGTNPSLLQALGAGAPTLAFDSVFNREVMGDAGSYYSGSASSLAGELSSLMSDPARRAMLSAQGPDTVRGRYSWTDVCDTYLDLLAALAEGRSGSPTTDGSRSEQSEEPSDSLAIGAVDGTSRDMSS